MAAASRTNSSVFSTRSSCCCLPSTSHSSFSFPPPPPSSASSSASSSSFGCGRVSVLMLACVATVVLFDLDNTLRWIGNTSSQGNGNSKWYLSNHHPASSASSSDTDDETSRSSSSRSTPSKRLSSNLVAQGVPHGSIWQRWDRPHNAEHGTWIIQEARVVMRTREITMLGSTDQVITLAPLRGGTEAKIQESVAPPDCTERISAGIWHIPNTEEFWDNYWHWNMDTYLLLLDTIAHEVDREGKELLVGGGGGGSGGGLKKKTSTNTNNNNIKHNNIMLFSGLLPPNRLRRNGETPPDVTVHKLYDQLSPWVKESLEMTFGGKAGVVFLGPSNDDPNAETDERVICVDRLYVGADRQCAHQGDKDSNNNDKEECQALFKLWRQAVWTRHGVVNKEPLPATSRPVVFSLVTRAAGNSVSGKRMLNEKDVVESTKQLLRSRYGTREGIDWKVELHTCDDIADTTLWWAASSVVALGRGACQANIPLTRDGASVIYLSLCAGGAPQLTPQPNYFTTIVHQQENPPPDNAGGCNYQDYTVNIDHWVKSAEAALDASHPQ